MATELPIVCSLDAVALTERQRQLAAAGSALLAAEGGGRSHGLRFRRDSQTDAALEEIVRAESECCPFLGLSLDRADGELTLSIEAPEGGEETAEMLVAALRAGAT
jgi:hypothetical protein